MLCLVLWLVLVLAGSGWGRGTWPTTSWGRDRRDTWPTTSAMYDGMAQLVGDRHRQQALVDTTAHSWQFVVYYVKLFACYGENGRVVAILPTGGRRGPPAWPLSPPAWPGTWSWPGPGWCSTGRRAAGRTTSGITATIRLGEQIS